MDGREATGFDPCDGPKAGADPRLLPDFGCPPPGTGASLFCPAPEAVFVPKPCPTLGAARAPADGLDPEAGLDPEDDGLSPKDGLAADDGLSLADDLSLEAGLALDDDGLSADDGLGPEPGLAPNDGLRP